MKIIKPFLLLLTLLNNNTHAQNVGIGTLMPQSKLDIDGDLALRSADLTISSVYNPALDVNTIKQSVYKLKPSVIPTGNFILNGITASVNGRMISLLNRTGVSMEIYNEDIAAVAQNRISTGTGTTIAVFPNGSVMLSYDTAVMRWSVLAAHNYNLNYFGGDAGWSLTGNAGTTAANFIGTNDGQPLRFRINGGSAGILDSVLGNTAFGVAALRSNQTGLNNIAIGKDAMKSNNGYAQNNVAIGAGAMENNIYAEGYVAIGYQAMQNFSNVNFPAGTLGANHNTAVGYKALQNNTANGTSNTAVGGLALQANTTGYSNTAMGDFALNNNTTGFSNSVLGAYALQSNTTGKENTAIGKGALSSNTTGYSNSALGVGSLASNTNGLENTATGYSALNHNTSGQRNAAFGTNALYRHTSGLGNTAVGYSTLYENIDGVDNAALGQLAAYGLVDGIGNTAIGTAAMEFKANVDNNTIVGYVAFANGTATGSYNTALGAGAMNAPNLASLNYSTAIGNIAGPTTYQANFTNSISIGHDSHANGTDRAEIGSTFMQVIGGYKPWTTLVSDGRFKKNVQQNVKGLDFILQLQPVTYTVDYHALEAFKGILPFEAKGNSPDSTHQRSPGQMEKLHRMQADKETSLKIAETKIQSGFIAQDVLKAAKAVGYDFDGVNKPQHDKDNYSIAYSQFVVPLVKAVQEQQAMIESLLKRIEQLEKK